MEFLGACLLFVCLPALTLACSCVQPIPNERQSVRDSFCYSARNSRPVVLGEVVEATCSCSEASSARRQGATVEVFSCHEYKLDTAGGSTTIITYETLDRVYCAEARWPEVSACSDTLNSIAGGEWDRKAILYKL